MILKGGAIEESVAREAEGGSVDVLNVIRELEGEMRDAARHSNTNAPPSCATRSANSKRRQASQPRATLGARKEGRRKVSYRKSVISNQ